MFHRFSVAQGVEVKAGHKHRAFCAGKDQAFDLRLMLDPIEFLGQCRQGCRIEDVRGRAGTVEGDEANPIFAKGALD